MQSLDDQCALIFIWCYVNLYASKLYISVFKIYQRLKAEGGCSWCSWWRGPEGGTMFLACSFLLLLYPISFVVYSRLPLRSPLLDSSVQLFQLCRGCDFPLSVLCLDDKRFKLMMVLAQIVLVSRERKFGWKGAKS
jgi:hypothetical protein